MTLAAGAKAPDFTLNGIEGEIYSLADALDRGPVVLAFFKTTCGTCDLAFPYVNRLWESYPGGWSLWAVAQDPPKEARKCAQKHGLKYPVLPDESGYPVSKLYDPPATPTLFLIDRRGEVVQQTSGFSKADLNSLSAALAQRLGVEPAVIAAADDGKPEFKPG